MNYGVGSVSRVERDSVVCKHIHPLFKILFRIDCYRILNTVPVAHTIGVGYLLLYIQHIVNSTSLFIPPFEVI